MFKHLLVPLDGSFLAEAALPAAHEIARRFGSEITLFRVVQQPHLMMSPDNGSVYGTLIAELHQQARMEAQEYLARHQKKLKRQELVVHTHIVETEVVAEAILEAADELGIDGIVMSTHGRGGIRRWVFGSVADKVLRQSTLPVILIRAQDEAVTHSL
jgi:nucleotide-binding universal stress UspA family protein